MAIRSKRSGTILAIVLIIVSVLVVIYHGWQLAQARRYNAALVQDSLSRAGEFAFLHGRFARAFYLQQKDEFGLAVEAYGDIAEPLDDWHTGAIKFNMSNIYLRRGLDARVKGEQDVSTPLIELAKEGYRDVLRRDPQDWGARYNLEMALRAQPDIDMEDDFSDVMPERSPFAAGAVQVLKELP
ncbi:MAG: hypothetical protein ACR2RB_17130 [Gammaproteobacteria bacterium]